LFSERVFECVRFFGKQAPWIELEVDCEGNLQIIYLESSKITLWDNENYGEIAEMY
jgi:hypothetical protein